MGKGLSKCALRAHSATHSPANEAHDLGCARCMVCHRRSKHCGDLVRMCRNKVDAFDTKPAAVSPPLRPYRLIALGSAVQQQHRWPPRHGGLSQPGDKWQGEAAHSAQRQAGWANK